MKKLLAAAILSFGFQFALAQTWTGATSVTAGQTINYTFTNGIFYTAYNFTATGGMVNSKSSNGTTYSCNVTWTTVGSGQLTFYDGNGVSHGFQTITISCPSLTTPNATFSYPNGTNICGSGSITYSGGPPTGLTWYWQTSSTGTSTSNSSNTFPVPASGVYYLRAYCSGSWSSAELTTSVFLNTIPTVTASDQTFCSGAGTNITLTNNLPSTTNTWTVSSSNSSGASNSSGVSGSSSPYTYSLNQNVIATSNVNGTATYTITPSANGCTGSSINVTATAKPIPSASFTVPSQTACSGATTTLSLSTNGVSGATYAWGGSGSNVVGFYTPSNATSAPETLGTTTYSSATATFTAVPAANGCTGSTATAVIYVNPIPTVSLNNLASSICSGASSNIQFSSPVSGTTFTWTISPSNVTGGAAQSTGIGAGTVGQTLQSQTGNTAGSIAYNFQSSASFPNGGTCSSTGSASVSVNPAPSISTGTPSQNVCSGSVASVSFTNNGVSGTTYNWSMTQTNVTGASTPGSSATSTSPTLTATALVPGTVNYTITPSANGCSGTQLGIVVNVNPIPTITLSNNAPTICSSSSTNIGFSSPVSGTTFTWTVSPSNVSGAAAQSTGVAAGTVIQALTSTNGTTSGTVGYSFGSSNTFANGGTCTSSNSTSINLNPNPVVTAQTKTFFVGSSVSATLTSNVSGSTFNYTVSSAPNISNATSGSGSTISQPLTITDGVNPGTATYAVTASANSCTGAASNTIISIYPQPIITSSATSVFMGSTATLSGQSFYDSYSWQNSAGTSVGTLNPYGATKPDTYRLTVVKSGITSNTVSYVVNGQFTGVNQNYVIANTLQVATSDSSRIKLLPVDSLQQGIQYYDGHGRLIQTVATQASPGKNDLVSAVYYDGYGRQSIKYLPFASGNNGLMKTDPLGIASNNYATSTQYSFYNNGTSDKIIDDTRPFQETVFEASDLNRAMQQYGAGQDWKTNNKYVNTLELVNNSTTESIIAWDVSTGVPLRSTASNPFVGGGFYKTGQLVIQSTKDEQGNEVREYVDKLGHTILKKVQAVTSPSLNDSTSYSQTYYIYDDFGLLRYVLQPELVKSLVHKGSNPTATDLTRFAFQYQYDGRNRMTQKQVPGAGAVYMVYDNHDRLVMTQDANQRPNNQWLLTKYDVFNRPVITAIYTHGSTVNQSAMTGLLSTTSFYEVYNGTAATHGYSSNVWPTSGFAVLTATYYDNYNFVTDLSLGSSYNFVNNDISEQTPSNFTNMLTHATGSKINILGTSNYLYGVTYYDNKYRTIQAIAQNNKGGWDRVTSVIDFIGRVLNGKTTHHTNTHSDQVIAYRYTYDHGSRKIKTYQSLNNEPNEMLLSQNNFNEIGQLVEKNLHLLYDAQDGQSGTLTSDNIVATSYNGETSLIARNSIKLEPNFVMTANSTPYRASITGVTQAQAEANGKYFQSVDYRYNIRGWLASMNNSQLTNDGVTNDDANDLFGMNLGYNTGIGTGNAALYNGNISAMKWSSNLALGAAKDVGYNYSYDPLNRLIQADYRTNTAGVWANASGQFNESGYVYDLNGNIKNLVRNGSTGSVIDNLAYSYTSNGNQLQSVNESAGGDATKGFIDGNASGVDYAYDANGNMVTDKNKSLTATDAIVYNYLNLPTQAIKNTNEKIVYTYDAGGRKLMQQVFNAAGTPTKTTDYVGDFIYQGDTLQFINHAEGRVVTKNVIAPEYQYHLKDHLGNVRLTFTTEPAVKKMTAGFEAPYQTTEASYFGTSYPNASHINTVVTNAHTGNNSLYLNGSANGGQVGVAKTFSVMPGDVVSIQAYAKYNAATGTQSNLAGFATALLSAFNLTTPAPGETGTARAALNTWGGGEAVAFGDGSSDNTDPRTFATILMFDRNFTFLDVAYQQLTSSGVMNATYSVKLPGYAYVYVSNEEGNLRDVYIDDVTISQTMSPVVQSDDFYPFGLTFNSYTRENTISQNYLYNEKEQINDLNLDWADYGARMYMPEIGRWGVVDPLSEKMRRHSPYNYAFDNPIRFVDPDGMGPREQGQGGSDANDGNRTESAMERLEREYYENAMEGADVSGENGTDSDNGNNSGGDDTGGGGNDDPKKKKKSDNSEEGQECPKGGCWTMTSAAAPVAVVAAGADGPVPIGDILGAGLVVGAVAVDLQKQSEDFKYVTYTKTNAQGSVYVGRSSGYGSAVDVVARRDQNHHMSKLGYGPAVLSTFARASVPGGFSARFLDPSYWAIRGSEQLQIETYRKLGISGNARNGIDPKNSQLQKYIEAAKSLFD